MAITTKIVVQQAITVDQDNIIVGKYPRYIINMGSSISSITATELATAVDQAQTAAAGAKASEVAAKTSEDNSKASELASKASEVAAKTSEDNSKASEVAAKASEVAAKDSELASKASEDAAKISENNAAESKRLAELAKQGAETAETNAKASEIASKTSEDNSKASEIAAKTSETNAKISETNAGVSEGNAETEAIRAEAAADRAEATLDSKLDKGDIAAFFKGYQTKAQADADVNSRVPGEKILVWNQDGPKYSWYVVKDTAGVLSLELESDELKTVSVNNIRPDNLGNVQVTIPGGNPSLWLGEVTWFPYDKDNTIGYSGILLADGREVRRVDYPDTWIAIETGLIPSVTEVEWQAGQNMYFSTGDGSTTFRLPNLLQGQAFRAASIGEAGTSQVQEQIPFITTVNGVAPEDASGAVVIGITNLGGILPTSQGGTGTTTVDEARKVFRVQGVECNNDGNPGSYNAYRSPTGARELRIRNEYGWGVYETASGIPVPLDINEGGTGAINAAGARQNIELERYNQSANETYIQSPDRFKYLTISNDSWGAYDSTGAGKWVPLGILQGGTGGNTVSEARTNLQINRLYQDVSQTTLSSPNGQNLLVIPDTAADWSLLHWNGNGYDKVPLSINAGGTGATTVDGARDNLNLGTGNDVGFRGVNAHNWNDSNEYPSGGFLTSILYNTSNGVRAIGRLYSEISPDGIPKTVIQSTDNAGRNAYMSYDVNGLLQGVGTLSVNSKIRTPTIAVTDRMSVGTPGDDQGLGERSIAIGDHDSGLKQISDGNIAAMADGLEIFRWAPQGLQTDKRITSNYGDTLGQAFYVGGKRTLSNGCLIGGKVEGGGWDQWRDRAAAVMVESDTRDAAVLIWKAVKWDDVFISGMSTTVDNNNNYQVRLHVSGANFIFGGDSVATAGQWASTSDIRLKAQLKEIVSAKDKVKVLQGYTYFKRNSLEENEHSFYTEEAGLIAQDVVTVLPEAVYKVADTDYLSINYAGVTALLVEAIKELSGEEENLRAVTQELTKTVSNQEEELRSLRAELDELKALVASLIK